METKTKRPGCDRGAEANVERKDANDSTAIAILRIVGRNHIVPHLQPAEDRDLPTDEIRLARAIAHAADRILTRGAA